MNESKSGLYFSAIVVMFAGLASRSYRTHLPSFIGEYSGDVLWALMLFLVVIFILAGRPLVKRCIISLVVAFAVEVSQLYHALWIDGIRNTTLSSLVLGFGFLWSDLPRSVIILVVKPTILFGNSSRTGQSEVATPRYVARAESAWVCVDACLQRAPELVRTLDQQDSLNFRFHNLLTSAAQPSRKRESPE